MNKKEKKEIITNQLNTQAIQNAINAIELNKFNDCLKLRLPYSITQSQIYENNLKSIIPKSITVMENLKNKLDINNNIEKIARSQLELYNSTAIESMTNSINKMLGPIVEMQKQIMNAITERMNYLSPIFLELSEILIEAQANPNSKYNWMKYYDELTEYFWIIPYKMPVEELKEILENVATEKEFDKKLNNYFSKKVINELLEEISLMLIDKNQNKMFKQIIDAYNNKSYALASVGIITMIDNILSYYILNKGFNKRVGIFEPILEELDINNKNTFIVMMVNSNINLLYEDIEFNRKINIKTNKKSRRSPMAHGKSYSYKKIDTIMLLNTMYYLLLIQKFLSKYENKLYYKNNKFNIIPEDKVKELKKAINKGHKRKVKNKV